MPYTYYDGIMAVHGIFTKMSDFDNTLNVDVSIILNVNNSDDMDHCSRQHAIHFVSWYSFLPSEWPARLRCVDAQTDHVTWFTFLNKLAYSYVIQIPSVRFTCSFWVKVYLKLVGPKYETAQSRQDYVNAI